MTNLTKAAKIDSEIPPVSELIDKGIHTAKAKGLSLHDIARQCGMINPSSRSASPVFSMLRSGTMRLPLERVIAVADNLELDRRQLLISQIRDSLKTAMVKKNPEKEIKEFEMVWNAIGSILLYTHTSEESAFIQAFREVEEELDQKIEPDQETIEQFKEVLRNQYAL